MAQRLLSSWLSLCGQGADAQVVPCLRPSEVVSRCDWVPQLFLASPDWPLDWREDEKLCLSGLDAFLRHIRDPLHALVLRSDGDISKSWVPPFNRLYALIASHGLRVMDAPISEPIIRDMSRVRNAPGYSLSKFFAFVFARVSSVHMPFLWRELLMGLSLPGENFVLDIVLKAVVVARELARPAPRLELLSAPKLAMLSAGEVHFALAKGWADQYTDQFDRASSSAPVQGLGAAWKVPLEVAPMSKYACFKFQMQRECDELFSLFRRELRLLGVGDLPKHERREALQRFVADLRSVRQRFFPLVTGKIDSRILADTVDLPYELDVGRLEAMEPWVRAEIKYFSPAIFRIFSLRAETNSVWPLLARTAKVKTVDELRIELEFFLCCAAKALQAAQGIPAHAGGGEASIVGLLLRLEARDLELAIPRDGDGLQEALAALARPRPDGEVLLFEGHLNEM